jgi:hypothetical protein
MCLKIAKNPVLTAPTRKTKVYKRYTYTVDRHKKLTLWPMFYGASYSPYKGLQVISNRSNQYITQQELSDGVISKGIHCYTTKRAATKQLRRYCDEVIVQFTADPEDFIAKEPTSNTAVYHKLTLDCITDVTTYKGNHSVVEIKNIPSKRPRGKAVSVTV